MGITISWANVENKLPQIAKWTLHAGWSGLMGYSAGYTINMCDRWLHPVKNALGKPPLVNPIHGVLCGVTFALVDRIAKHILALYLPEHIVDSQITHAARKFISIAVTSLLASAFFSISFSMACVLITTNVVATVLLGSISKNYDTLIYKSDLAAERKQQAVNIAEAINRSRRQPELIRA